MRRNVVGSKWFRNGYRSKRKIIVQLRVVTGWISLSTAVKWGEIGTYVNIAISARPLSAEEGRGAASSAGRRTVRPGRRRRKLAPAGRATLRRRRRCALPVPFGPSPFPPRSFAKSRSSRQPATATCEPRWRGRGAAAGRPAVRASPGRRLDNDLLLLRYYYYYYI